jgi:hypothetical protein
VEDRVDDLPVEMSPSEIGQINYTLLWLYAGCFVLIWIYLPLVEEEEREGVPSWLFWSLLVLHVAGFGAMVIYLTGTAIASAYVWRVLLTLFMGFVFVGDVMCYRWMMRKPNPRASLNQNRIACFIGAAVHTIARLPCAVVIFWLAERR